MMAVVRGRPRLQLLCGVVPPAIEAMSPHCSPFLGRGNAKTERFGNAMPGVFVRAIEELGRHRINDRGIQCYTKRSISN